MNVYLASASWAWWNTEISQWHQHTNPTFTTNMLGHTVVGWHLPERYMQTKCATITRYCAI